MADKMTKEQRHKCMSHIRSRDTGPELVVRRALFAAGFRFRVNVSSLPGSPDIVLRRYNTVIFVNGCFWHGHAGCRLYVPPRSNVDFWRRKVERNRRRDTAVAFRLEALGWNVVTVWECSLSPKRRKETLALLEDRIRRNGETHRQELARRREMRDALRSELSFRKARTAALLGEVDSICHIPASVRKASEDEDMRDS